MAYGQWKVLREETIDEFGYDPDDLTYGSKKPVICKCEECNIISNKRFRESNRKHICNSIINNNKKCFKCKEFKDVDEEFSKNKSTFDGYAKVCKTCFSNYDSVKKGYKKQSKKRKECLETYFRYKTTQLKRKSKSKGLDFDLGKGFLYELYKKQNGKCFYTKMDIIHNEGIFQDNSITVDRIDPNKGYIMDNVVLSSFNVNSFKGMMNENEFKNYLTKYIPLLMGYVKGENL